MTVNVAEFQANFAKYLELVLHEDIFITRDGDTVAKMVNPRSSAVSSLRGLLKNAPDSLSREALREDRLQRYENHV